VTEGERVVVGRVGRPHGLDGSFVVEDASEDGRWFEVGATLLVDGDEREVIAARRAGGRPVIRLAGEARRGARLEVLEEGDRRLGRVVAVVPGVANDALQLDGGALLPLVGDCVRDIDLEAGRILVAPGFSDPD
jgi:16S rRNA processing protein RimM